MLGHKAAVQDDIPEAEWRERAAKLIRLLGSDAAGEAEAARAALVRLLARHDLAFDDLARRLLAPAPSVYPDLRANLEDAERRLEYAATAERRARREIRRLRAAAGRLRIACAAIGGVAALLVAYAWLPRPGEGVRHRPPPSPLAQLRLPAEALAPTPPPAPKPPPKPEPKPAPAPPPPPSAKSRVGRVLPSEGVLLRLDPVPGAPAVAVLPHGAQVGIDEVFPMLGTDWMQVQTAKGAGFVPADAIGRE